MSPKAKNALATSLIHGDHEYTNSNVAPPISVTTTFRTPASVEGQPDEEYNPANPTYHVYSRYTQDSSTRAEKVLGKILNGYALTYASGLAAAYSALVYLNPSRVAITGGYHGVHVGMDVYKKSRGETFKIIDSDDEYREGDICWLETPINPTGEARDIKHYADKIHAVGGKLIVDATFGPPPLQDPFKWGADIILHSGTKYFGGHSDLLCGVLAVKSKDEWLSLWHNRTYMGNMMGSLESWLLLRSLRTLHLRVPRQSQTATALATWLNKIAATPKGKEFDGVPGGLIEKVCHASLQGIKNGFDPASQLTGGFPATFAIFLSNPAHAGMLPHSLKYFVPATSLGGVESLIERRLTSDPTADPRLVRLSVGVEELEDLKEDLRNGLRSIMEAQAKL